LATSMPPICVHSCEERADQQCHAHDELKQQNEIGAEGRCTLQKSLRWQIGSRALDWWRLGSSQDLLHR
jgi:hypothetical protein